MHLSLYVNAKALSYAKVLFTFALFITINACVTQSSSDEAKKEEDVLNAQYSVVVNYLEQGLAQKAHQELRPLLKEHPKDPKLYNLMGLTNLAFQKPAIAVRYFKKANDLQEDPAYTLNLSSAYIEMKKYGLAVNTLKAQLSKGLGEYPYPERFYHNLAYSFDRAKKANSANKYYAKALEINPSYYPSILQLAKNAQARNDRKESVRYYEQAMDACLNCIEPVKALVEIYKTDKQNEKAASTLRAFLNRKNLLAKDKVEAQKMLSFYDQSATKSK